MRANLGARAGPGHVRAAAAARPRAGSPSSARRSSDAEPALAANAMSASAMWAANAATVCPAPDTADGTLPPDRRQSEDHAAPQPRMAGDAGAAAPRLRRRAHFAVHGPVPPRVRRRGRGQSHAAGAARTASRASRCSSMACRGGPFPARQHVEASKAIARLHRLDPGADPVRRAVARKRSPRARSTMTSSRSPTGAVLFAHEKAFADKRCAGRPAARALVPEVRIRRGAGRRGAAGRRDPLLSVQRPAGHAARRRDDPGRADRVPRHAVGVGLDRAPPRRQRRDPPGRISSMSASRWPMAAARPACGCASSPTRPTVDPRFLVDEAKLDRIARSRRAALAGRDSTSDDLRRPALIARHRGRARARCSTRSILATVGVKLTAQFTISLSGKWRKPARSTLGCLTIGDDANAPQDRPAVHHQDPPRGVAGDLCHRARRGRARPPLSRDLSRLWRLDAGARPAPAWCSSPAPSCSIRSSRRHRRSAAVPMRRR